MSCTYRYPSSVTVQKTFWFTKRENVDLTTDSQYSGRVQYICDNNKCTLRITDLRESDSAKYKFRFITNRSSGKYSGSPGVTLFVTDLQVSISSYPWANCHSSYRLPYDVSYIWYKNGQKVQAQTSSYFYLNTNDYENSYSCAVNRCEDLVSPPVCVDGQNCNRVTYTDRSICAFKGSSVDISCTYNSYDGSIMSKFWFSPERSDQWQSPSQPEDLSEDSLYAGHVQVLETESRRSTLRISDLRDSDSAQYYFKFKTSRFEWRSVSPGTTLTVTALQVQVNTISVDQYSTNAELKCHSSCSPAGRLSYVWFKNGQKVREETSSYKGWFNPEDIISCALKGHENYGSPSVCARGQNCNRVTYTDRSICASKGSSVDISCTYSSYDGSITSKFWFSPKRSDQWQSPSQPEDLSEDSLYAGRVQVLETESGRSTLRIRDLRESDSAQYHFKFKTSRFEWRSVSPGTTLTVTALQVQVNTISVTQNNTEAELKCHSSCSPAGRLSYVWFKNGQKVTEEETSSYEGWFSPEDFISCALKGHENYGSPSVYAPKLPSVSVSPSGEIVENSSVTLTCSSDANPAAKYTWYKKNRDPDAQPLSKEAELVFRSIQSSDSGEYYCTAENELRRRTSESISINVKYAPKLPSVSVSPSGEIVEGSAVSLTCSSDANPAANYTWYKENEDSPKASGQIFTITDFRPEHSGNYYCEAQNRRGRHNSTLHLIVVAGNSTMITMIINIIRLNLVVVMLIPLLLVYLWMRKKKTLCSSTEPNEPIETMELDSGLDHINVSTLNRATAAETEDTEEQEDLV